MKSKFASLIDILHFHASVRSNKTAYVFLEDGENELVRYTYEEVDRRARAVAAQLQEYSLASQPVLLLYPSSLDFIIAFLGCLYAKVVAVPVQIPGPNKPLDKIEAIIRNAGVQLVLTDTKALASLRRKVGSDPLFESIPQLKTDEIDEAIYKDYKECVFTASDVAFLQYTSGSTGMPKGVMVSQGNMVANITAIHQAFGTNQDSTVVGWLPFHHDMGLIGNLLAPLQIGMQCVLMPPLSFLQVPGRWLRAIDKYQAFVSGGPNFAYDLCCKRISDEEVNALNLSSWKVAFNGAEPVRANTMREFANKFSPAGFNSQAFFPCYGMAETTLIVSGEFNQRESPIVDAKALETQRTIINCSIIDKDAREFVGCGNVYGDQHVEIVEVATGEKLGDNKVGEIWVSGSSVAQGYWNNPERTKETFQAFTQQGEGPFLRTGDFGFVMDGRLFITGRQKDMIIVRGRNYYPQDIELSVENCHEALRKSGVAVFSVIIEEEEKVVVVAEVERLAIQTLQASEVFMAIRQVLGHHHELESHAILLLKPMALPKTSSGKNQRFACRKAYSEGTFSVIDSWQNTTANSPVISPIQERKDSSSKKGTNLSEATIRAWLTERFAQHLKVDRDTINLEDPIEKYGLSSLTAVEISGELTEWLHQDISPTIVYDYPTIALLASHLAGKETNPGHNSTTPSDAMYSSDEPIAIVGMQCRFPGAPDIQSYWNLLSEGKEGIKEVLPERWSKKDVAQLRDIPDALGFLTKGGFLDEVALFDAGFFGISPREATYMDPQQRIWLEVSWEALENAGIAPQSLEGKRVGVFVGVSSNDYIHLQNPLLASVEQHSGTGNALSIIANRLSYALDLRGPSMCIDTACSSSLVAIHQACQSLRNGESELTIAGGVNLILNPKISAIFGKSGMLAKDARCKVLDAEADGYVRGEGCGVVILKRLSDAIKDGDTIQAIIKGSAINQDGKSNGLTAPNGLAQQSVIRDALRKSTLSVDQIGYFEIHGTGTSLGDPIEVNSLVSLLKGQGGTSFPRWIGSVKSNIGHLESAAGIAGLIKAVLCLKHAQIPPQINFNFLNPRINLAASQIKIPTKREKWEIEIGHKRVAGVSAFGFGGTNAHVLVEEAPVKPVFVQEAGLAERSCHLLALSARDPLALQQMGQRYLSLCESATVALADLAYSANTGRSHFAHRLIFQARDIAQLQQQLSAYTAGQTSVVGLQQSYKPGSEAPRIAFLFTGQGSQYPGMGRELFQSQAVFRSAMQACDALLQGEFSHSLLEVLYGEGEVSELIHQTQYAQPAIFSVGYALYQLWSSWGIRPQLVLGHSIGEYIAACVSGRLSLEEALPLVAKRGRLMQNLPAGGKMYAIQASAAQVQPYLAGYQNRVSFAAINGPDQVVISGEGEAMEELRKQFQQAGLHAQALPVSHAFHSPLMRPIVAEFEKICQQVTYGVGQIELISSQLGQLEHGEMGSAAYWVDQLEQPVLFSKALDCLRDKGYEVCLELGAQPVLVGLGSRLAVGKGLWLSSLRRGRSDWSQLASSVSSLYAAGVKIDWEGYEHGLARQKVSLPTYPFQRKKYWVEETDSIVEPVDQGNAGLFNYLQNNSLDTLIEQLAKEGKIEKEAVGHSQKVIQSLVEQYQQDQLIAGLQEDFYKVTWVPQPLTIAQKSPERPSWLIFTDEKGVGRLMAEQWEAEGKGQVILVYTAAQYEQRSPQEYYLNPTQESHFKKLVSDLHANHTTTIEGLCYLGALNTVSLETSSAKDLLESQLSQCEVILHLIQLVIPHLRGFSRFYLVTQGVHLVSESAKQGSNPSQATLWGVGKSMALEFPEWQTVLLDLDDSDPASAASCLLAEMRETLEENQISWKDRQRFVARLIIANQEVELKRQALVIDPNASYLVTGGYGTLGVEVTRWLVSGGGKHIFWVGRKGVPAHLEKTLDEFAVAGVLLTVLVGDIAETEPMEAILATISQSGHPLKGIFHVAGTLEDGILLNQNRDKFEKVFRPKIAGAWNLHILTRDSSLDFFVSFSSVASLLGAPAQANYAAANAFLDGLAEYRHQLGLTGLSINWGPWEGLGMAAGLSQRASGGLKKIDLVRGVAALAYGMTSGKPRIAFLPMDKTALAQQVDRKPFLSLILKEELKEVISARPLLGLVQELEGVDKYRRQQKLSDFLCQELAKILRVEDAQLIDKNIGFAEMGLDSMMAVELKNKLQTELGTSLSTTALFNYSTVHSLAQYLLDEVLVWNEQTASKAIHQTGKLVETSKTDYSEPIAIIGLGCRFPGGVSDLESFWQLLSQGKNAIHEVPAQRWDIDSFYHPVPGTPGKMYARHGGFIDQVDAFDAEFFGISPREAISMDPQQRLLLEVSWEALENAGVAPVHLHATQTGIFVGIGQNEYAQLAANGDFDKIDAYVGTGNGTCFSAGRLSYSLGTQGPSIAIDTACSSSLVSTHLACQSLRQGECNMALAGGVQLIVSPATHIFLSNAQALSPTGQCKSFSNEADGYVRGEGCGMIVLKRLSDAIQNGDNIVGVIRGSAVNHDGRSSGLTVPNGKAQTLVIKKALENAGVNAQEVSYVEAHGTGTSLGDPIEIESIGTALTVGRNPENQLWVGSVKTNVGHLEAAAGIVGLLKVLAALQHQQIPPHLHFSKPNSHVDWEKWPISIPTKLTAWEGIHGKRIAGISSFGLSGTNAHLVVEEAPAKPTFVPKLAERPCHLLALSARDPLALQQMVQRYLNYCQTTSVELADLVYSANTGRSHFAHRLTFQARDVAQLQQQFKAYITGQISVLGLQQKQIAVSHSPRIAFLFTGQGSQYPGMGRELYQSQAVFRSAMQTCDAVLHGTLDHTLLEVLYGEGEVAELIHQSQYAQPAIFSVGYALYQLWLSWGVQPHVVLGHSVGEYIAACVLGRLSLEAALQLVARQSQLEETVLLDDMMEYLRQQSCDVFLELGAHPVLAGLGSQPSDTWINSLRRGSSDWQELLGSVSSLHLAGVDIDWQGVEQGFTRQKVNLPTYPFQHKKYWVNHQPSQKVSSAANGYSPSLMDLLSQGNTEEVIHQIAKTGGMAKDKLDMLPELLELLMQKNVSPNGQAKSWQYQLVWNPISPVLPTTIPSQAVNTWVLFADQQGMADVFAQLIANRKEPCYLVKIGERFEKGEDGTFFLNPDNQDDFRQLFQELTLDKGTSIQFVYLWALDLPRVSATTLSSLEKEQHLLAGSVLNVAKEFILATHLNNGKLWLITQETIQIEPTDSIKYLLPAVLWGIGKVISLEYPKHWGGLIDIEATSYTDQALLLLTKILDGQGEQQMALRKGQLFVPRLAPLNKITTEKRTLSPDRCYLVTGGLGHLGLKVSHWLVSQGARCLALVGRKAPTEATQAAIRELEQTGITVLVQQGDVTQEEDVQRVFQAIEVQGRPLAGIIHAAGITDFQPLASLSLPAFEKVSASKIVGGWVLHELSASLTLDFFVCFSSISSVWGSKGQAHYAAGNHFLDALCHYRKSLGLPAMSINWGLWLDDAPEKTQEQRLLGQAGIMAMQPAQAFKELESALFGQHPQIVIADVDWTRLKPLFTVLGNTNLFENIEIPLPGQSVHASEKVIFFQTLEKASIKKRKDQLTTFLQQEIARVLKWDKDYLPPLDRGFFEMGFDSLMALEFKARLEKELNCTLPSTIGFDFPTIQSLANYLIEHVLPLDFGETGAKQPLEKEVASAEVDNLSFAELTMLLEEEIKKNT